MGIAGNGSGLLRNMQSVVLSSRACLEACPRVLTSAHATAVVIVIVPVPSIAMASSLSLAPACVASVTVTDGLSDGAHSTARIERGLDASVRIDGMRVRRYAGGGASLAGTGSA